METAAARLSVSTLFSDNVEIATYLMDYLKDSGCSGALFAMGRSLGSASAIDLVQRFPDDFKGLILDSGFADTLPLLRRLGCDLSKHDLEETDCFKNIDKIRRITLPTMIIHGGRDTLIPVAEAEKLQAESAARTKQFHIVPGADHNSLIGVGGSLYFETIKNFIDSVTGKNTWRQRRKTYKQIRDLSRTKHLTQMPWADPFRHVLDVRNPGLIIRSRRPFAGCHYPMPLIRRAQQEKDELRTHGR